MTTAAPPARRRLTAREAEVAALLCRGLAVKEVAMRLGLSPHTVGDHVKAIHRKLGVASRGQLLARLLGDGRPGRAGPA